jgi:hypothetical protein
VYEHLELYHGNQPATSEANHASTGPHRKRRARQYHPLFEAVACNVQGTKVDGISYRLAKPNRDARYYQFRDFEHNVVANDLDPALCEPPICKLVRRRLRELLSSEDIDLLYLRLVAGWRQADIAREQGCHRSSVKRREDRIRQTLLADPILRQAAVGSQHSSLFMGESVSQKEPEGPQAYKTAN